MLKKYLLFIFASILFFSACSSDHVSDNLVKFPSVSDVIAITSGPKEHLFASYYGINSWDRTERYVTILETSIKYRLPTENDPATLGLVDLRNNEFIPLVETRAWNFQQGCMAHWLATCPDSLIIYNDIRQGKFVSVILNVITKQERVIPYPISAVSPNGREAVSINFARLRQTRVGYGYGGNGQDARMDEPFPEDDGLFLVDLETGDTKLIVSIALVKEMVPELPQNGREYFNHTLFSRDGSKIFWLARAIPERNTTAFTVNPDGSNLQRCFPDGWGGSHFDWLNANDLMITARYKAKLYSHILFTVGQQNYQRLGNGLLDFDGHGTFSPDEKWMVTHTYPDRKLYEQRLYLMDMKTNAVLPIGHYLEPPKFHGDWRCDLHPRWSPSGSMIGFNSTHEGSRQVYVIDLRY